MGGESFRASHDSYPGHLHLRLDVGLVKLLPAPSLLPGDQGSSDSEASW